MPKRIQRRRTKGWRKPEGAVYVGRGSKWGNPYKPLNTYYGANAFTRGFLPRRVETTADATDLFDDAMNGLWLPWREHLPSLESIRSELAGKDLMCWCQLDQPCHADVLLELANREEVGDADSDDQA